jgi:hypothetical protein
VLVVGATLVVGVLAAGIVGPRVAPPNDLSAREDEPGPAPVAQWRTTISLEESRSLVVTSPQRSGSEVTTPRLTVTGYVVGPLTPVRISLQGRGNRIIETQVVDPARDPTITRPQRVARFSATFDVPNPRPNGEMLVEFALLGPDGAAFDVIWRYVRIGAIEVSDRPPDPATTGPGAGG